MIFRLLLVFLFLCPQLAFAVQGYKTRYNSFTGKQDYIIDVSDIQAGNLTATGTISGVTIIQSGVPVATVSDTAYNATSWDNETTIAPSKNAVRDKIESLGGGHDAVTLAADAEAILGLSTQEINLDTQTANYVFAGPTTGAAADPTFRALVAGDIPDISATYQPKDADLTDLADGSLTASKVAGVADADYGDVTVSSGVWTVENAAVIGKVITGFSSGAGALAGTDTLLQAINKLDGNIGTKEAADANIIKSEEIDTISELDAIVADANILSEEEIDASSELAALMDDETGTAGKLVFSNSPTFDDDIQLGLAGATGILKLYSEQGVSDYTASFYPNTAMTSNASFYLPADEPAAQSFLSMSTAGAMSFVAPHAGTNIAADLEEEVTEGSLADSTIVSADIKDGTIAGGDLISTIAITSTGSQDYGGGSFEIPNSASDQAIGTAGQIGINTTDEQLSFHSAADGEISGEASISLLRHITATFDPAGYYDQETTYRVLPLFKVGDDAIEGITITEWRMKYVGGDPTTELDCDLMCDTTPDFNPAAGATVMDVVDTTNGASTADTGFDSASCVNGSEVYLRLGADPTDANKVVIFDLWFYNEED